MNLRRKADLAAIKAESQIPEMSQCIADIVPEDSGAWCCAVTYPFSLQFLLERRGSDREQ